MTDTSALVLEIARMTRDLEDLRLRFDLEPTPRATPSTGYRLVNPGDVVAADDHNLVMHQVVTLWPNSASRAAALTAPAAGQLSYLQDLGAYQEYRDGGWRAFPVAPVGAIMPYAGATAPAGWLLCQGQAVSRTTYARLYAVCGVTYGVGDGTSTFNLPDLRGRVGAGLDTSQTEFASLGKGGPNNAGVGEKKHTLTVPELASHGHDVVVKGNLTKPEGPSGNALSVISYDTFSVASSTAGSGQGHNNIQPYLTLNHLISTGGV